MGVRVAEGTICRLETKKTTGKKRQALKAEGGEAQRRQRAEEARRDESIAEGFPHISPAFLRWSNSVVTLCDSLRGKFASWRRGGAGIGNNFSEIKFTVRRLEAALICILQTASG